MGPGPACYSKVTVRQHSHSGVCRSEERNCGDHKFIHLSPALLVLQQAGSMGLLTIYSRGVHYGQSSPAGHLRHLSLCPIGELLVANTLKHHHRLLHVQVLKRQKYPPTHTDWLVGRPVLFGLTPIVIRTCMPVRALCFSTTSYSSAPAVYRMYPSISASTVNSGLGYSARERGFQGSTPGGTRR